MFVKVWVLLVVASGAFADKICFPDQFEWATTYITGLMRGDKHVWIKDYGTTHYDVNSSRVATVTTEIQDGKEVSRSLILIVPKGNTSVQYHADLIRQKCAWTPFDSHVQKVCLPGNGQVYNSGYLGPFGDLKTYLYKVTVAGINYEILVSKKGVNFFPVSSISWSPDQSVNFVSELKFFNVTQGIKDQHVFDVPKYCHGAKTARLPLIDLLSRPKHIDIEE